MKFTSKTTGILMTGIVAATMATLWVASTAEPAHAREPDCGTATVCDQAKPACGEAKAECNEPKVDAACGEAKAACGKAKPACGEAKAGCGEAKQAVCTGESDCAVCTAKKAERAETPRLGWRFWRR